MACSTFLGTYDLPFILNFIIPKFKMLYLWHQLRICCMLIPLFLSTDISLFTSIISNYQFGSSRRFILVKNIPYFLLKILSKDWKNLCEALIPSDSCLILFSDDFCILMSLKSQLQQIFLAFPKKAVYIIFFSIRPRKQIKILHFESTLVFSNRKSSYVFLRFLILIINIYRFASNSQIKSQGVTLISKFNIN